MKNIAIRRQTLRGLFARVVPVVLFTTITVAGSFRTALAQVAPSLGTAQSFAVLGASTVTNTGPTIITGNLGVSPGTSITGFPPGTVVGGTTHAADAVAAQAQNDTTTAYGDLASQACNTTYGVPKDIGGMTLVPGVYCFTSSAQLTGTLTLNAQGDPNAVFIFKVGSTLTTASNSSVLLINGAQRCNVFWQIGSSATLGTGTSFIGNILALTSITLNTDATLSGRALAQNGAVTLDSNTVSVSVCAVQTAPTLGVVFTPPTIDAGGHSTITLTLSNPDATAANLTAPLIDTLPTGLVIEGTASNTCGGALTAPSGGSQVTLTGGSIPGDGSCTVTFGVTAPGEGNFINSLASGALKTSKGNSVAPAAATLTVNALAGQAPSLSKAFSPSSILAGGDSNLTITLHNPNRTVDDLTAPLTDTFPSGVVVNGAASTTCGGTVTATKGGSKVTLTGGHIPANGSCTVTVCVTAPSEGNYFNSLAAGALKTDSGSNATPAVATLTVHPVAILPTLSKSYSPATIKKGGTAILTIILANPGSKAAHMTAPLTDNLPGGQVVSGNATTTCGGWLTATKGSSKVILNGGTIPAEGSCKVTVSVTSDYATKGVNTLPAGALHTCQGNNAASASATLIVLPGNKAPTLSKWYYPSTIKAGGVSLLTITLYNPSDTIAYLTAPLIDNLPGGQVVSGWASTTCKGSVTANKGSSRVTLAGGSIPAYGSCKVTVDVTVSHNNRCVNTLPAGALKTCNGSNADAASATLTVNSW